MSKEEPEETSDVGDEAVEVIDSVLPPHVVLGALEEVVNAEHGLLLGRK